MPWNSKTSSSFSLTSGSRSSLCWKPLQPPPTTRRRRYSFSGGSVPLDCPSLMISFTFTAAFSVSTIAISDHSPRRDQGSPPAAPPRPRRRPVHSHRPLTVHLVSRTHLAQAVHDSNHLRDHVIDLLGRREPPQPEAQTPVRQILAQ